jgi:hypothetical protein
MARRAQQGAAARCPYCDASVPQVAAECPSCKFPLTMAAADFGYRAPDRSGTTSTATPGGRSAVPVLPGGHDRLPRSRVHGSKAHSARVTAWLLGVTALLLLLAGIGAVFTATSSGATSDREANANLITLLHRATDDPNSHSGVAITAKAADAPSEGPFEVSVDRTGEFWFGAARSSSGQCFVLAAPLAEKGSQGRGTLGKKEPCTGAEVRRRFEQKLIDDKR